MRLIAFDTENTDLRPGQICQIAYIIDDGSCVQGRNLYFTVDEMSENAYAVHGLSLKKLNELSGGKRFSDSARELYAHFTGADVICGHNVAADMRFLTTEFERAGICLPALKTLCTMNSFTKIMMLERRWPAGYPKPPKLSELAAFLDISYEEARRNCDKWFEGGENLHDARFDCTLTYMCVLEGIKRNYLSL